MTDKITIEIVEENLDDLVLDPNDFGEEAESTLDGRGEENE